MPLDRINKAFLCFIGFILSVSAHAEGHTYKLSGVAFAQVAELGSASCFGETLVSAADCAKRKCDDNSGEECFVTRWCWPAQTSGELQIQNDDVQFVVPLCGHETLAALIAVAQTTCEHIEMPATCTLISAFDENGGLLELPQNKWLSIE